MVITIRFSVNQNELTTHVSSSTNLGHTPASITAWILSFVPSERYESAQQASVNTSSSLEWMRCCRAGSAGFVYPTNKKHIEYTTNNVTLTISWCAYPLACVTHASMWNYDRTSIIKLVETTSMHITSTRFRNVEKNSILCRYKIRDHQTEKRWSTFFKSESPTCSNEGCGLPLQKLESVQVAFRNIDSLACSFNWDSKGTKAPWLRTRSRHLGESPATFPKAHTAYTHRRVRTLVFTTCWMHACDMAKPYKRRS